MAYGLTPNYTQDQPLDGLTPAQYLAACVTAARFLDWDVRHISDAGLIALTEKKVFRRKQKFSVHMADGLATVRSESIGSEIMDWGRNRKRVEQFLDQLAEVKNTTSPEQLDQIYEALKPELVPQEQDILSAPPATARARWGSFFSLFVPREGFFVTPLIVDLNILLFILMVLSGANIFAPDSEYLIKWGANVRFLTLDGQWWRVITCCFLHIGILHLLLNMYALLYIGLLLEPRLGRGRFASAYVLTGIMASVASLYWHENTLSAGASGAIFGMYGVFLALLTTSLLEKTTRGALLASIGIFVAYNLLNGLKGAVDNAAHIGGLLSGIAIGYLYYPGLSKPDRPGLSFSAILTATVLVVLASMFAFRTLPNDYVVFQQKMVAFAGDEQCALAAVHDLNSDTPKDTWLHAINDSGIYYWNQCLKSLNEASSLKVSDPLKHRTGILIQYCNLRVQAYAYYSRRIAGSTPAGEDSLTYYNSQISDLMDQLKDGQ
ncbi:MAG TPA: rhomboid family intramembrane serine protease [Puia sp.]|nr:rhomboid family intramembrane serine protease [Puia sp.]